MKKSNNGLELPRARSWDSEWWFAAAGLEPATPTLAMLDAHFLA